MPPDLLSRCCIALLMFSGFTHIPLQLFSNIAWDSPVSFRKAILFGLSTGITLWSLDWVQTQLRPIYWSRRVRWVINVALVVEVNRSIEQIMGILILIVTAGIVLLTLRCFARDGGLNDIRPAMRCAIRSGMVLLVVSCGLGIAITAIGKYHQSIGLAPEFFGALGRLKFPHGAVLHAIQVLVAVAWATKSLSPRSQMTSVRACLAAHLCWFAFAMTQTFRGRARFEMDTVGLVLVALTIGASLIAFAPLAIPTINRAKVSLSRMSRRR
jgi:hypothetical protein